MNTSRWTQHQNWYIQQHKMKYLTGSLKTQSNITMSTKWLLLDDSWFHLTVQVNERLLLESTLCLELSGKNCFSKSILQYITSVGVLKPSPTSRWWRILRRARFFGRATAIVACFWKARTFYKSIWKIFRTLNEFKRKSKQKHTTHEKVWLCFRPI